MRIEPSLTRSQFRSSKLAKGAKTLLESGPWRSIELSGTFTSGLDFVVVLIFNGERLEATTLVNSDPKFGTTAEEWPVEKELERKRTHDRWLQRIPGPRGPYAWGSVCLDYDERSGSNLIIIRYS